MQAFFHRILSGRYGEWPTPSFGDVINRVRSHADAVTDFDKDEPSVWLRGAKRDAYSIFFSDKDPLREKRSASSLSPVDSPLSRRAPGHTPLACRLELFDEIIDTLRFPEASCSAVALTNSPTAIGRAESLGRAWAIERC